MAVANTRDPAGTDWSPSGRSILLLEADTINRFATERLLRREEYWVFATHDPSAAVRVAAVSAVDLMLVDLGLGLLEAIPRWQRRRCDVPFGGAPPSFPDGYAVLRPLHLDPSCARFPIVTLKADEREGETAPPCRYGVVDYVPRAWKATELLEGLETVFREIVQPALERADGGREALGPRPAAGPAPAATARPDGRAPQPAIAPAARPFESTPVALRTALVVDPDPTERRFVVDCLTRHGFAVHEASTGAEALRLAVARRPWLLVTEGDLPDQNGLDFCRQVRSHSLLRRTPVVFLAARDDCESRYQALKSGADDYLAKPVSTRELLIRLELLLKRFAELELGGGQGAGLRGAVELVGAPAVLQICHLNQLTGVLVARRGSRSLRIAFRRGDIVSAAGPDHQGAEVVYDFIGWPQGQFEFDRDALVEGPPMNADFNGLLLEGCRRLDERRRGRLADNPAAEGPTLGGFS